MIFVSSDFGRCRGRTDRRAQPQSHVRFDEFNSGRGAGCGWEECRAIAFCEWQARRCYYWDGGADGSWSVFGFTESSIGKMEGAGDPPRPLSCHVFYHVVVTCLESISLSQNFKFVQWIIYFIDPWWHQCILYSRIMKLKFRGALHNNYAKDLIRVYISVTAEEPQPPTISSIWHIDTQNCACTLSSSSSFAGQVFKKIFLVIHGCLNS